MGADKQRRRLQEAGGGTAGDIGPNLLDKQEMGLQCTRRGAEGARGEVAGLALVEWGLSPATHLPRGALFGYWEGFDGAFRSRWCSAGATGWAGGLSVNIPAISGSRRHLSHRTKDQI